MESSMTPLSPTIGMALILTLSTAAAAQAPIEFPPDGSTSVVFGGKPQTLEVRVRHPSSAGAAPVSDRTEFAICFRLFQEASGVAAPLGPARAWKRLSILPGQTLIEKASVEFPAVKHVSNGLVRWETEDGNGLGSTRVRVVPTNLLTELKTLTSGGSMGVVDASTAMTALFEGAGLSVEDLADLPRPQEAQVILVMPGELAETQPALLARRVRSWVESGRTVVWFKLDLSGWTGPWAERHLGQGSLVTAEAGMVERLDTAEAQWRLVNLMRWACRPTVME
jgi:hypothetical protein